MPYRGGLRTISARAKFSSQRYGIEYTKGIFRESGTVHLSPCLSVRGKAAEKRFQLAGPVLDKRIEEVRNVASLGRHSKSEI